MDQEYDFSELAYEYVMHDPAMPFKAFFTSIGYRGFHWHRELELILVLEGEVSLTRPDSRTPIREGELLLLNPYEPHGLLRGRAKNVLLVIQVDPDCASGITSDLAEIEFRCAPGLAGREAAYRGLRSGMARIMRELIGRRPGYEFACMEKVFSILRILRRDFPCEAREGAAPDARRRNLERLRILLDYMHENSKDPLRLAEVAALVDLSPYYVSHFIKESTGLSFQQNLNIIRTHRAMRLILATDKRFIDIALEAGFSDIKYLNKCLKELFGVSPSELRSSQDRTEFIKRRMRDRDLAEAELMPLLRKCLDFDKRSP